MSEQTGLEEQFALYQSLARIERWKVAHEEAMYCRKIEDAIEIGLAILKNIRRRTEIWAREVEHKITEFSSARSQEFAQLYRSWFEYSSQVLEAIKACEEHDYQVEGAEPFRQEHREVSLMSLDIDRARESIASLEEGRGIPAAQAMDELRHRLRSRRS